MSPDGSWLAYVSGDRSADEPRQVCVVAADGVGGRVQISRDGGTDPAWSPDGTKLYFRAGGESNSMMVVELTERDESGAGAPASGRVGGLVVSPPEKLFDLSRSVRISELTPDGTGFLATSSETEKEAEQRTRKEIIVTLHFSKVLERLLAAERG